MSAVYGRITPDHYNYIEVTLVLLYWVCVHRMLAYRAEDISQRLEPQELYDRQEFEESIQFDVSAVYYPHRRYKSL